MCGFLVTAAEEETKYIKRRGPDSTGNETASPITYKGLTFQHFLLSITGNRMNQPFAQDQIFCVYNGEIYSHSYVNSDGENIIPLYKQRGPGFARLLDGEFAIALYDFEEGIAVFATDPFGTKPLWVRGIECASYESGVPGGVKVPPNTAWVMDLKTKDYKVIKLKDFDFKNQVKDNYDEWIGAFERAVRKRAKLGCFIGLSSGYDTGGIALALESQPADWMAYGVSGAEDKDVLASRHERCGGEILEATPERLAQAKKHLEDVEPFTCRWKIGESWKRYAVRKDRGALGAAIVFQRAKRHGRKVYLSGQGGDEILSDYSKIPLWSHYKGVFPEDLVEWPNFASSHQEAFLGKEECVAGSFGIEARYPYLDAHLVQEFLWLTPELKNRHYKGPLAEYLRRNEYPNVWDKKIGFVV